MKAIIILFMLIVLAIILIFLFYTMKKAEKEMFDEIFKDFSEEQKKRVKEIDFFIRNH